MVSSCIWNALKPRRRALSMKTILIADDEEDIRIVISMRLQQLKLRVIHAITGSIALEVATVERPDLMILDWTLPDMNGRDVLMALKQNSVTASIPVIVLTGIDEQLEKAQALAIGACAYLVKPISMRDLEEIVLEVLNQKR
jgi:DNA-binding response OmpR family regulator